VRIARLEEAIAILRGAFADGPFSFEGQFYSIAAFDCLPKPVQTPHPPFLVGGTRERVLRLATREADIVGLDLRQDPASLPDAFPDGMDRRVGWVRDEAGDRFADLELSVLRVLGDPLVTNRPLAAARSLASTLSDRTGLSITAEEVLESPYTLIGSVSGLVDKLRRGRERWGVNSVLPAGSTTRACRTWTRWWNSSPGPDRDGDRSRNARVPNLAPARGRQLVLVT
jgi:alkanesulfonate monooxygenase SsuD/methylene tetrahydromethanopterin reductase-like flavin-dependent oxidoreductase (luciferase family)